MQSISIKFFVYSTNRISALSIPLLNKREIEDRIDIFVQTRPTIRRPHRGLNRQRVLVKDLFQKKDNEFFIFPHTHTAFLTKFSINENLLLLRNFHNDGIVLCFIPKNDTIRACVLNKKIWIKENSLESLQDAEFLNLSKDVVSVFCFEGGWISQSSDGKFILRGIEIIILQTGIIQGLLCKKVEIESSTPERPLHNHPLSPLSRNSKFIKLSCFCRCEDFSFQITLPVLTSFELQIELKTSRQNEWDLLSYSPEDNFFDKEQTMHQAICFPDGMGMKLPFHGVTGWQLFFSFTEESNNLLCIFLPTISDSLILKTRKDYTPFCEWQTGQFQYSQIMPSQVRPYCFNISQMSLIQKDDFEYCVEGGDIKLVSKEATGVWGLFFSLKQKAETCFSDKQEAVSTATASSLLSPDKDSIKPQKESSRKRLYPFQPPLVERPSSQSEDTNLLQPLCPPFSIIEASPLATLQPLVASMVQFPTDEDVMRLEPLQLPPLPFPEPAGSWQQQDICTEEEEKNEELETLSSSCIFEDYSPVSSLKEVLDVINEMDEKEKQLQKKSSPKGLYPPQAPLVERPPTQSKDTNLLHPSCLPFSIIEASPFAPLQSLADSMVYLPDDVARLEQFQLPPLPFPEPAIRWQQQDVCTEEDEKNQELEKQFSCIFEDYAPVSSLEEIFKLMDEIE